MPVTRPSIITTVGNISGSGLPSDPVGLKASISISDFTASAPNLITVNSVDAALRITQTGTGDAFIVEDFTSPDSTPFIIKNNGRVGIANTDPQTNFQVGDHDETGIKIGIVSSGSSFSEINFSRSGSVGTTAIDSYRGVVGYNHATGTLYFHQDGARAITISGSQNVGIGTSTPSSKLHVAGGSIKVDSGYGIIFNASSLNTGSAYSSGQTLTSYEIGAWTPVISSSTGFFQGSTSTGTYVKVGMMVFLTGYMTGINNTGRSGQVHIAGLPFVSYPETTNYGSFTVNFYNGLSAISGSIHGILDTYNQGSKFKLYQINNVASSVGSTILQIATNLSTNSQIQFTAVYQVYP